MIEDLNGEIFITSNPKKNPGTEVAVTLTRHFINNGAFVSHQIQPNNIALHPENVIATDFSYDKDKQTILILEDNPAMLNYLTRKILQTYNVQTAINGNEALKKLKQSIVLPDLIIFFSY